MITHHFLTDNNIFSGYFADDYGQRKYSYHYDPYFKVLPVECEQFGRKRDLSNYGIDRLPENELRDRPIALAQAIGKDLTANLPVQT